MNGTLTRQKITEIVGDLGPERVLEILDTGATEMELIEAKLLALEETYPGSDKEGLRDFVVHRLYDILRADLIEQEEP